MSAADFARVRALFDAALDIAPETRAGWLREACAGDTQLHAEVLRLLARDAGLQDQPEPSLTGVFSAALEADSVRQLIGARVGRYRLIAEIGQGGMGRVFRAVREEADDVRQEVALKLLRREMIDSTLLARFRSERRILAALSHPGIARLIDLGESEDGIPYIVMELVRGEPITRYCTRLGLGMRERLELFRQVLAAVSHAHRNLIVHRDIKPANVLVDEVGQVKLLDFGIAKPLHSGGDATATSARYLTPNYAAPEQFVGGAISVMSDVYALGALLHEMLTGHPPLQLDGLGAAEIERRVLQRPPDALEHTVAQDAMAAAHLGRLDLSAWRRMLRGDLDSIVHKALRKEPQSRYLGVEAFDADIANFLANRPVQASGSRRIYRAVKFVQRNRLMLGVICGAMLAVTVALALAVRQAQVAAAERDGARAAMAVLSESFRAADPMRVSAGQVSAAEILRTATQRTSELRQAQPQVHAGLTAEIGEAELALGIVHPTHAELDQAVAWADGSDPALARRLRLLRARQLIAAHELDAADALLSQLEQTEGSKVSPEVLTARAHQLNIARRPVEAIAAAERAVAALADEAGSARHVEAVWQLAEAQRLADDAKGALRTLEVLGAQFAQTDHPRALLTQLRLIRMHVLMKDGVQVLPAMEALLTALEQQFGANSTVLAVALGVHAQALEQSNQVERAVAAHDRAIEASRSGLGVTHANTLMARYNRADMLHRWQDARADSAFQSLLDDIDRAGVRDTRVGVFVRQNYVGILTARGDLDSARRTLLPDGFTPRLADMRPGNRRELASALRELFGPISCGRRPAPDGSARARAAEIACAADPESAEQDQ